MPEASGSTAPIDKETFEKYIEQGMTRDQMAKAEGCSVAHIKRQLAANGINLVRYGRKHLPDFERRSGAGNPILINPTPEEDSDERLEKLRWEGMTKTEQALEILGNREDIEVEVKASGYYVDGLPVSIFRILELAGLD